MPVWGFGADIYVSSTGSNTSPYDTWAKAATSLGVGIGACGDGDTLWLDDQTWTLSGDITIDGDNGKISLIRSRSNNPALCVIQGNGSSNWGFYFGADSVADWDIEISGITFNQCRHNNGGAIFVTSNVNIEDLTITNCVFTSNSAATGSAGAIYFNPAQADGVLHITDSTFTSNTAAAHAGAIYSLKPVNISGSEFTSNSNGGTSNGGALLANVAATINNTAFTSNTSTAGGGAIQLGANGVVDITSCTFTSNTTAALGGGIRAAAGTGAITISDTDFTSNSASRGGGFYTERSASFSGVTFTSNNADQDGASGGSNSGGGAMIYGAGVTGTFTDCTFDSNTAAWGGGSYDSQGALSTFTRCVFKDNFCDRTLYTVVGDENDGGGAAYHAGGDSDLSPTFNHCVIYGNTSDADNGGGAFHVLNNNTLVLNNCTVYGNEIVGDGTGSAAIKGSATYNATLTNSIFWDNDGDHGIENSDETTISYSIHQGALGGSVIDGGNNKTDDPLFTNASANDFRLTFDSPCRDAGTDVWSGTADIDAYNNTEITDGSGGLNPFIRVVDIGAYEGIYNSLPGVDIGAYQGIYTPQFPVFDVFFGDQWAQPAP